MNDIPDITAKPAGNGDIYDLGQTLISGRASLKGAKAQQEIYDIGSPAVLEAGIGHMKQPQ